MLFINACVWILYVIGDIPDRIEDFGPSPQVPLILKFAEDKYTRNLAIEAQQKRRGGSIQEQRKARVPPLFCRVGKIQSSRSPRENKEAVLNSLRGGRRREGEKFEYSVRRKAGDKWCIQMQGIGLS